MLSCFLFCVWDMYHKKFKDCTKLTFYVILKASMIPQVHRYYLKVFIDIIYSVNRIIMVIRTQTDQPAEFFHFHFHCNIVLKFYSTLKTFYKDVLNKICECIISIYGLKGHAQLLFDVTTQLHRIYLQVERTSQRIHFFDEHF